MAANVESMFYVRETPWHGLGTKVQEAPDSKRALVLAGLDWKVIQMPVFTGKGQMVPGYKANVRDRDQKVLGIVTDRYKVVQNEDAFSFTDELLRHGVVYETAGSIQEGRKTWILARMPREYIITGEQISPYLVFSNSHDGSGAVKVALTPVRVVCQNTLNLALEGAKRSWSMIHTGDIRGKLKDAEQTLGLAEKYMASLGQEIERLQKVKIPDRKIISMMEELLPLEAEAGRQQKKNMEKVRDDMKRRYFEAPDLKHVGKNAYRFLNAVSDFATHAKPLRETANYKENLFARTMDGHSLIDRAYQMVKAA